MKIPALSLLLFTLLLNLALGDILETPVRPTPPTQQAVSSKDKPAPSSAAATAATTSATTSAKKALLKQVDERWKTETTVRPASETVIDSAVALHKALLAAKVENVEIMRIPLSAAFDSLLAEAPKDLPLNFVLTGTNDPEVTLTLKKTNLAEALDLLVESAGMTCDLRGTTIVVMPNGTVGALKTRYFPLSRSLLTRLVGGELAKAPTTLGSSKKSDDEPALYQHTAAESAIKSFLERLGIAWPEGSGMVLADGELIVTHNTRTLDRIAELLARLKTHRQVEIEARFLEVGEGALNELGVQWNLSNRSGSKQGGTTGVTTGANDSLRNLAAAFGSSAAAAGTATPPQIPSGVNLATNTTANADVTGFVGATQIRGILSALSQQDGTELLSAPRLLVLSGSTASITVAQEMRYPQSYDRVNTDVGSGTSSAAGSILTAPTPLDFTTRNVGVQMQVTPYVEDDNSITLILSPEVTQFERFVDYGGQSVIVNGTTTQSVPSGFFQPVFNVRKLTTEVNIPSGSTVLLGGLTREESVKIHDKVPLLGDVPLLGRAFRHEGTSTLKKNLVVFVTAKLIE